MPAMAIGELLRAVDGQLLRGDETTVVTSFDIDTRRLREGSAFFALKGTRTDGHEHLGDAARRGAAVAVIEREPVADAAAPPALLRVDDAARALGRAAARARSKLRSTKVIAITGSTGKTMTKELAASALAPGHRVHRTEGNLNNHLGLPLTVLACPEDAEFAVFELGMNAPGEVAELARIAEPDVALVTNVRPVHLEFFRDLDGIAAAKGELFAVLRDDGVSVVNLDDEHVRVQSQRHAGRRVTFGKQPSADLHMEHVVDRFLPGAAFTFSHEGRRLTVELRLGGAHAAWNALAALAVVVAAGGDLDAAVAAVARVEPGPGRGRVHRLRDGITLIDDTYNSNPAAMASVLRTLRESEARRKVLVVGDMLELGPEAAALHREVGKQAAAAGVKLLFGVGRLAHAAGEAARRSGVPEIHQHQDSAAAARELPECVAPGDLVLIKGSRGVRLERVVEALVRAFGDDGGRRSSAQPPSLGETARGEP